MLSLRGFLLGLAASTCMAEFTQLQWSDCGSDPSVRINKIEVSPMPVVVPGDIQLTVDASYGRPLGDVTVDLSIRRHTFLLDLPIPCIAHVGSCTYESSCSSMLLDTMVAEDWAGIMGDIGSQVETMLETSMPNITTAGCPYPARSINIDHYTLHLPPVPTILSWFAEGDYGARAEVTDKATGDMLLCLHLDLTIKEPCTGFFCG